MSARNDGGQAFPVSDIGTHGSYGMTLRDAFAIAALPQWFGMGSPKSRAEAAYADADAMLVQRDTQSSIEAEFKNFHRLLCERFGYSHDERDWKRDQVSVIEKIAGSRDALLEALETYVGKFGNCGYAYDKAKAAMATVSA